MTQDLSIYTGQLRYENVDFEFVFDRKELRLILPVEKKEKIDRDWLKKQIVRGLYTDNIPIMKESYLMGKCNENSRIIIFITQKDTRIDSYNSVLVVKLIGYILCDGGINDIDRIVFKSQEINHIYPINQAYQIIYEKNGKVSLIIKEFNSTLTKEQEFAVDKIKVKSHFYTVTNTSHILDDSPLSINSALIFDFEKTNDYNFIIRLFYIAKQFMQFLCYRRDVYLPNVDLYAPYENGKHLKFATLHINDELCSCDLNSLKEKRYISQSLIAGYEGKILADIADNSLYLRHLPETYKSGRLIDASRFVMLMAAFEWEFKRMYPSGISKDSSTIQIENEAMEAIEDLINKSKGKLKKKYKFLKNLIKSDNLQSKIIKVGNDFDDAIGNFGKNLYELNNETLDYFKMGDRLANQRNNFAHGNLNKDFIGLSLLDLIYLEYMIYAMQLRYYGISDINIRKAINNLFRLNYYIE